MLPFLYQTAELFYGKHKSDILNIGFVFPNRRAGIFFQKYLAEIAGKPVFSPEVMTGGDLFLRLSELQIADSIGLLFEIYEAYKQVSNSSETFDEFSFWGEMLLKDFDDVDKYLVDAKQLFTNITNLKEIDSRFDYLTEEQIAAIRRFWANFIPVGENRQKKDFLQIWEILYPLYVTLKERLAQKGLGYEGMIFRSVAERAAGKEDFDLPFSKLVFIGFNALSLSEITLLKHLKKSGKADFYWDYDAPWVKDPNNKSSFFIAKNKALFPSEHELKKEPDLFENQPEIELIGIPSSVGQAKEMCRILERLSADKNSGDSFNPINTAVILPDERLLMPVLHSVPEAIDTINVTMGYPLSGTPVAGLMDHIAEMQRNIRFSDGTPVFYYKYVLPILNHRYVSFFAPEETSRLIFDIQKYNRSFLKKEDIPQNPVFDLIFQIPESSRNIPDYLLNLLTYFQQAVAENDADEERLNPAQLEKEFIYRYYLTINRLKDILSKTTPEISVDTYFRLLKKIVSGINIPFVGEPLSGLQIMGALETRALNFENLIILSMNEGVYPKRDTQHSFIPGNLRKGFNLPDNEHHDAVFAYNFYRVASRAKRIFLLYDTRSDGMQTGEISRFVYQLKYHYHIPLTEKIVTFDVELTNRASFTICKNRHVTEQLNRFFKGGDKALSASAVNTYIHCPLKFYLLYVEGLSEEDEVSETVAANVFGSIFHQVMQDIYDPLAGRLVTNDVLTKIKKDDAYLTKIAERAFAKHFRKSATVKKLTGQDFLVGEIIRKYVKQVLEIDRKRTPFTYIASEFKIPVIATLDSGKEVNLKGFIDRIDQTDETVHILDYKTGSGVQTFKNIDQLFDKKSEKRPKDLMQVLMYSLLYDEFENKSRFATEPGIYYLRTIFSQQFTTQIAQKENASAQIEIIDNFSVCKDEFKAAFLNCLEEIFSPDVPFVQTEVSSHCEYCPFTGICGR